MAEKKESSLVELMSLSETVKKNVDLSQRYEIGTLFLELNKLLAEDLDFPGPSLINYHTERKVFGAFGEKSSFSCALSCNRTLLAYTSSPMQIEIVRCFFIFKISFILCVDFSDPT